MLPGGVGAGIAGYGATLGAREPGPGVPPAPAGPVGMAQPEVHGIGAYAILAQEQDLEGFAFVLEILAYMCWSLLLAASVVVILLFFVVVLTTDPKFIDMRTLTRIDYNRTS